MLDKTLQSLTLRTRKRQRMLSLNLTPSVVSTDGQNLNLANVNLVNVNLKPTDSTGPECECEKLNEIEITSGDIKDNEKFREEKTIDCESSETSGSESDTECYDSDNQVHNVRKELVEIAPSSTCTTSTSSASSTSSTSTGFFSKYKVKPFQFQHLFSKDSSNNSKQSLSLKQKKSSESVKMKANHVSFCEGTKTWDGPSPVFVDFDELLFCFLIKGKAIGDGDILKWTHSTFNRIFALCVLQLDLLHRLHLDSLNRKDEDECHNNCSEGKCKNSIPCLPKGGGRALKIEPCYEPYLVTLFTVLVTALKQVIDTNDVISTEAADNLESVIEHDKLVKYLNDVNVCLNDVSNVKKLNLDFDFNSSTSAGVSVSA